MRQCVPMSPVLPFGELSVYFGTRPALLVLAARLLTGVATRLGVTKGTC